MRVLRPWLVLVCACTGNPVSEPEPVPETAALWRGVYRITEVHSGCEHAEKVTAEELFGHGFYAIDAFMLKADTAIGTPCASPQACWDMLSSGEQYVTVMSAMDLSRDFTYSATAEELTHSRVQHLDMRERTVVTQGAEVVRTEGFDDEPGPCKVTTSKATVRRTGEALAFEYRREVVVQPAATECEEDVVPLPTGEPVCDAMVTALLFAVPRR